MSKHTPGPWQVGNFNKDMICDCDGEIRGCSPIAYVEGTAAEKKANARLIASSPDLLAALLAIAEEAGDQFGHKEGPGTINRMAFHARQAIAKATGGKA